MIPAKRRENILELVETQHSVSVAELCNSLDVSEMTIRRDLRMLSNEGLLLRVHGGAVSRRGRSYEPPYMIRTINNPEQKMEIGAEAAKLVEEGDSIAIDVGTTTLEVARNIVTIPNLTVLTSSLKVANLLADAPSIRLIVSGGIVRPGERSLIGNIAEKTFENFHVDKAFIGIGGLHPKVGLTEFNLEDTLVKQKMIQHAEQVIVVTDNTKMFRTCFAFVAPLSAVDVIVTDIDINQEAIEALNAQGVEVLLAESTHSGDPSHKEE